MKTIIRNPLNFVGRNVLKKYENIMPLQHKNKIVIVIKIATKHRKTIGNLQIQLTMYKVLHTFLLFYTQNFGIHKSLLWIKNEYENNDDRSQSHSK